MSARAWLAFGALGLIWGLPYFLIKLALSELSPVLIAWGRVLLATLIVLPIAWQRGALRAVRAHRGPICAFALVEFVLPFCLISLGERWISSSVTGILIATVPLTIALISRFFGIQERFGIARVAGMLVGFCGVAALLGLGTIAAPSGWYGVGCMLLATLGYAIGPLIVQRDLKGIDPSGPLAASLLFSSVVLLIPALLDLPTRLPSARALLAVAVLGVLCTALAMLLMLYLVGRAGAARASVVTYLNPMVATLLGVMLLGEPFGWSTAVAMALILCGSWLATRSNSTAVRIEARVAKP
jgi:drug/metabolite transporter (DMT)-like permease